VLKFVFWILVALNAVLFAFGHGYLGKVKGNEREPARIRQQVAPEMLTLLTATQAQAQAAASAAPAPPPADSSAPAPAPEPAPASAAAAAAAPQLLACTEVGTFGANTAHRFETRLAKLELGEHQARVEVPVQDVTSYLVHLPPQGSKEAAERKAAELRALGVENFFVMSGDSPLKWAISLGVFKSQAAAEALIASLGKQGVHTARIYPRGPQTTRFAYQFRDIDADTRSKIAGIADAFESAELKDCR
jgi:cell division septation protein DedD